MPEKKVSKKTATEKTKAKNGESMTEDGKRITKGERQKRLLARTDHKPGEAMLFRGKKERQKDLKKRSDRTA